MKKFACLALAVLLMLSVCACAAGKNSEKSSDDTYAGDYSEKIAGTWNLTDDDHEGKTSTLKLSADGGVLWDYDDAHMIGTYTVIGDKLVMYLEEVLGTDSYGDYYGDGQMRDPVVVEVKLEDDTCHMSMYEYEDGYTYDSYDGMLFKTADVILSEWDDLSSKGEKPAALLNFTGTRAE